MNEGMGKCDYGTLGIAEMLGVGIFEPAFESVMSPVAESNGCENSPPLSANAICGVEKRHSDKVLRQRIAECRE
jgi:hypothetical protein